MGSKPNPWAMLVVAMVAQVAGTIASNTPVFLIPYLQTERGLTLSAAGLLASASLLGTAIALIPWGFAVDRFGERWALTAGLAITVVAAIVAAFAVNYPMLAVAWFVVGAGLGSSNAASGRLVVGWFGAHRRGTAMGIRQTGLPLGVGLAALIIPSLANAVGLRITLLVVALVCAVAALVCGLMVIDPPRAPRDEADSSQLVNPYRRDRMVARVSAAATLLVIPQFVVWTFMLVWLIDAKSWSTAAAGALVAASQVLGAAGRIGTGWWSDVVGNRLRPMRWVALAAAAVMLALGIIEASPVAIAAMVLASVVTVADNGLAFTSVAELSGPYWSGRTLGVHNAGQYFMSALVPPVGGAAITAIGYGWTFALVAVFPLMAWAVIPRTPSQPRD